MVTDTRQPEPTAAQVAAVRGTLLTSASQRALVHALERAGWALLTCELDMHAQTARVELRRFDGRRVTLDARNGKATITREQDRTRQVLVGAGGCESRRGGLPCERTAPELIGRTRYEGARSALRSLCTYLADNAVSEHRLTAPGMRALFGPVMSETEVAS